MSWTRGVGAFFVLWFGGVAIVAALPSHGADLVSDLAVVLSPVLAGLLIASVGVFLGSLGNLYAAIGRDHRLSKADQDVIADRMQFAVNEIRQNVIFVIGGAVTVVFLPHIAHMRIPGLRWPIEAPALGPTGLAHGLVFAITLLVVYAVWDSVKAMFVLHSHYREILDGQRGE